MMQFQLLTLLLFVSIGAQAQNTEPSPTPHPSLLALPEESNVIDMDGKVFCSLYGKETPKLCDEYKNQEEKKVVLLHLSPLDAQVYHPWALRLYFGNANTFYKPTDMHAETSRLNINMYQVEGEQRNGYEYFRFWKYQPIDMMRWVDEPTNNLKVVFDRKNHQFFLSVNHPKMYYVNGTSNPNLNTNVLVQGTVDGVQVNGYMPLNQKFDGYNAQPGELNITKLENSWMFMQYEVGYGYAIPLIQTRKLGRIVFTPQVQAGIFVGPENSSMVKKGAYWDFDSYESTKYFLMGPSFSGAARLEWQSPSQRFGLFAEYKQSYGHLKYPFMDGTIEHDMRFQAITFGFSTSIRMKKKAQKILR